MQAVDVDNHVMEFARTLGVDMTDRVEMLEATLNVIDEGVAILDGQSIIIFWNKAAAALTGRPAEEVVASRCPDDLYQINDKRQIRVNDNSNDSQRCGPVQPKDGFDWIRPSSSSLDATDPNVEDQGNDQRSVRILASINHKQGHSFPGMLRRVAINNSLGEPAGAALLFYPIEEADQLLHGDVGEGTGIERSQADMEDRLDAAQHQWVTSRMPFGLLWITVDQAQLLRRTHGCDACESMLRTMEQTLLRQMKPAEILGRWGNNEFLMLVHERNTELLLDHARHLAGLARTADFRWWGDRVGLTVSVGATRVMEGDTLQALLRRARQAMQSSEYAGGNRVTEARKCEC